MTFSNFLKRILILDAASWRVEPLATSSAAVSKSEAWKSDAVIDFAAVVTDLFHGQLARFPRDVEAAGSRGERVLLVAAKERFAPLGELL